MCFTASPAYHKVHINNYTTVSSKHFEWGSCDLWQRNERNSINQMPVFIPEICFVLTTILSLWQYPGYLLQFCTSECWMLKRNININRNKSLYVFACTPLKGIDLLRKTAMQPYTSRLYQNHRIFAMVPKIFLDFPGDISSRLESNVKA